MRVVELIGNDYFRMGFMEAFAFTHDSCLVAMLKLAVNVAAKLWAVTFITPLSPLLLVPKQW